MSSNDILETNLQSTRIEGPNFLRNVLANCTDPLNTIRDFQKENCVEFPSLHSALSVLDLNGESRLTFHASIVKELKELLLQQVNDISKKNDNEGQEKLKKMLEASFSSIHIKTLRPVILHILQNVFYIDDKYLQILAQEKDIYNELDLNVKRQIWKYNTCIFVNEITARLHKYKIEKENILFDCMSHSNVFFLQSPKARHRGKIVQQLIRMIGTNVKLYKTCVLYIQSMFIHTTSIHFCSLRNELTMAMHDSQIWNVTRSDPCHNFARCLDSCIQENKLDPKNTHELQEFLDNINRGQNRDILGDVAMILLDPFVINFLASSAIKLLQQIGPEKKPEKHSTLVVMLRMIALGLAAEHTITSQDAKEPKLDGQILSKFMTELTSLMRDDQSRIKSKEGNQSAVMISAHTCLPMYAWHEYLRESSVATTLLMHYALHTAEQADSVGLMRTLGSLASCQDNRVFEDTFLNALVSHLINLTDEFVYEPFCIAVLDEFFFAGLDTGNVIRHIMKLLWHVHCKLAANRLKAIIMCLKPSTNQSDDVVRLYNDLKERIRVNYMKTSQIV